MLRILLMTARGPPILGYLDSQNGCVGTKCGLWIQFREAEDDTRGSVSVGWRALFTE